MSRFSSAAKALRGPFKKQVRKLELTLRKPVIKKLGAPGQRVARNLLKKDEAGALKAAKAEAARLRDLFGKDAPTVSAAAVDRRTGLVVGVGHSAHDVEVPKSLAALLPNPSLKPWESTNCAEVAAASRAVQSGSKVEDLVMRAVRTRNDSLFAPCDNCATWVKEGI